MPEQIGAAPAVLGEAWGQAVAEDKLLKRVSSEPSGRPRHLSDLFDPTAFEERLKVARVRRALALAQREARAQAGTRTPASPWAEPDPRIEPAPVPQPPRTLPPHLDGELPRPPQRAEPSRPRPAAPRCTNSRDPESPAPDCWAPEPRGPGFGTTDPRGPSPLARIREAASRVHLPARLLPIVTGCFLAGIGIGTVVILLTPGRPAAPAPAASTPQPVRSASIAPGAAAAPSAPTAPAAPAIIDTALPPAQIPAAAEPPPPPAPVPEADAPLSVRLAAGRPYPRPTPAAQPTADQPPAADPAEQTAAAADLARIRVFVHFPPSVGSAAREAEVAALHQGGFATVEPIRANASIDTTNVRFFHAEDADAARRLAASLGDGAVVRDFTDISPPPRRGRLEVWMQGTAPQAPTAPSPEAILQILQSRSTGN